MLLLYNCFLYLRQPEMGQGAGSGSVQLVAKLFTAVLGRGLLSCENNTADPEGDRWTRLPTSHSGRQPQPCARISEGGDMPARGRSVICPCLVSHTTRAAGPLKWPWSPILLHHPKSHHRGIEVLWLLGSKAGRENVFPVFKKHVGGQTGGSVG